MKGCKEWELPDVVNTDKAPTDAAAIAELKAEGKCPKDTRHRQVKYLNNVVEADHGKLKQLIRPVRGFKSMKTAYATIKGFEVMRALRKGQAAMFSIQRGIVGEARIVERRKYQDPWGQAARAWSEGAAFCRWKSPGYQLWNFALSVSSSTRDRV